MTLNPHLTQAGLPRPTTRLRPTSIRQRILLLASVPALLIAGIWMYVSLNVQAQSDRRLLVTGAAQTAKTFSERILDLEENLSLSLGDPELILNAQVRAEEVIRTSTLPITDVAVYNAEGKLLVAFNKNFAANSSAQKKPAQLLNDWRSADPQMFTATQTLTEQLLENLYLSDEGFTKAVNIQGRSITLAASALPGGEGVIVTAIDEQFIQQQIRTNATRNIAILIGVLLVSVLGAVRYANGIILRIQKLSGAAFAIAQNDLTTPVPRDGNDEITSLQESIGLLRESLEITMSHVTDQQDDR